MSEGKDLYEERRKQERLRDLLREQKATKQIEREAASDAFFDLAIASLTAFLKGDALFNVNGAVVKFVNLSPSPTEKDDGHGRG